MANYVKTWNPYNPIFAEEIQRIVRHSQILMPQDKIRIVEMTPGGAFSVLVLGNIIWFTT